MTDREWDKRLHISTTGRADERGDRYSPYEPTAYTVLERLAASGLLNAEDHLLDYGCGKGRAVLFLAWRTGCRAAGIDFSRKLIDMAEENRQRFVSPVQARFIHGTAEGHALTDENAFFFFNPFSEKVLRVVLGRIRAAWYGAPRPLRLFFYYPTDPYLACLSTAPELRPLAEIDCRDLFPGEDPRERIVIYEMGGL